MQEIWVWSLSWEEPLQKEMATRSSILAWRIPWTDEPGRLQSMGSQRVRQDWATNFFFFPHLTSYISTGILPSLFPWGLLGTFPHPIRGRVSWLGQNRCHRMDRISQHCSSQPLSAPRSPAEWVGRLGGHSTVGVNQSSKPYGLDSGEC